MGFADSITKIKQNFAWSYSRYSAYKQCPAKYRYQHILKLPEEKSAALKRGGQIHDLMAMIMKGSVPLNDLKDVIRGFPELKEEILACKELYQEYGGGIEQQLAVNNGWEEAKWFGDDTWCRGIVDYWAKDVFGKGNAYLVDWKTGKFSSYAIDNYKEQLELFCAILFANDSSIKSVTPVLFFLDAGLIWPNVPEKVRRFEPNDKVILAWQERAMYMENDEEWKPKLGPLCRWCSFSREKNGPCKIA